MVPKYARALAFSLFLGCWAGLSSSYSVIDMPNPMHNPDLCGRKGVPKSVICDPENLLSKNSKDVIEGRIIEIEHKSKLQFGIAVVRSMFVLESQIDKEAKRFAESLHTTWGVGNKNTENGVLVFLAIDDRVVHISTGKGVKDKLTDVTIQSIIQHMRPYLKKEKYGEAIEAGVLEMDMVMENKSIGPSFLDMDQYGWYVFVGVMFAVICSYNVYKERQEAKLKEGKVALEKLMHEVKSAEDNKFQFDSCPICLEDFSVRRDPTDPEDSPHDHSHGDTDADSLLSSASHGSSAYTSSAEYREVRNLIPGASASPSAPSSSSSLSSDGMRPMTLHCGHAFCYGCLKEYLSGANRNTVCPVCRAPVDPATPSAPPLPPRQPDQTSSFPGQDQPQDRSRDQQPPGGGGSGGQGYSNPSCHSTHQQQEQGQEQQEPQQQGWGWGRRRQRSHFHEMEILYRLSRLQARYPTVVTPQSYETMRTAVETGNTPAFVEAAQTRTTEVARTLADIQKRREAAAKGSKGSSRSSFGGGSSSGGGGGGGRW